PEIGDAFGPKPDAVLGQSFPLEQFAGVLLPVGGHVAMSDEIARRNRVPGEDVEAEVAQRGDLEDAEFVVAEFVTGIDQLDSNRAAIQSVPTAPGRDPGVPGALLLRNQPPDAAIFLDDVVRGDWLAGRRGWVAQALDRFLGGPHP